MVHCVRKRHGKKEPPLRTVDEGLYWAVALGQNSRGQVSEETKGVCEVWGVGRGFIARAGVQARSSHIRKKARATAAGGVQGLRVSTCLDQAAGFTPRKFSQPLELVCGIFPGHTSTCPTFQKLEDFLEPVWKQCDPEERDLSEKSCWVNFHQTVGQHVLYISFYYLPC